MECLVSKIRIKSLYICIPLFIISIFLFVSCLICSKKYVHNDIQDISSLTPDQYGNIVLHNKQIPASGKMVSLNVQYIISNYMNDESGQYYLVKMTDDNMISMYVPNKYVQKFDKIYGNSLSYRLGIYKNISWKPVCAYGYLYKISVSEKCRIIQNILNTKTNTLSCEDILNEINPYKLVYSYKADYSVLKKISFLSSAGFLITSVLIFLIYPKSFIRRTMLNKTSVNELNEDFINGKKFKNVVFGQKYIIFISTKKLEFRKKIDLVWVYPQKNKKNRTFIILSFSDGSVFKIRYSSETDSENIIFYLKQTIPETVINYSDSLKKIYDYSITEFTMNISHSGKGNQ